MPECSGGVTAGGLFTISSPTPALTSHQTLPARPTGQPTKGQLGRAGGGGGRDGGGATSRHRPGLPRPGNQNSARLRHREPRAEPVPAHLWRAPGPRSRPARGPPWLWRTWRREGSTKRSPRKAGAVAGREIELGSAPAGPDGTGGAAGTERSRHGPAGALRVQRDVTSAEMAGLSARHVGDVVPPHPSRC